MRRVMALAAVAVCVASGAGAATSAGSAAGPSFDATVSSSSASLFSNRTPAVVAGPTVVVPVKASGALTVTFRGNRAAGCASRGLCGFSGTDLWQPPPSGELVISSDRVGGRTRYHVALVATPSPSKNGVAQAHVVSQLTSCTDSAPSGTTFQTPTHGRTVTITLKHAEPSLILTRCAGPLNEDYAAALISRSLDVNKLKRGRTAIDLPSIGLFAAHGFVGAFRSTISLALGSPRVIKPGPPGRTVRRRTVDVSYRVSVVGDVIDRFHGATQVCDLVGSCRLGGSVDLHLNQRGRGDLITQTSVGRPYRDALTALGLQRGGNPKGILALGGVELPSLANARGGLDTCRDTARTDPGTLLLSVRDGVLSTHYNDAGSALHTRCPGPLVRGIDLAARGRPSTALRPRTTTFRIDRGIPFRDEGYAGEIVAHLRVTMTRVKVTSRIVTSQLP